MPRLHISPESSTFAAGMSKRIVYIAPIESLRGSLAIYEKQSYSSGRGYDVPVGTTEEATTYISRLVAKRMPNGRNFYNVRTRTSVHMTSVSKRNMALMGGAGAIYAALVSDKTAAIYSECVMASLSSGKTLRAFMIPKLRAGLAAKVYSISIADGVEIVNPWISSDTPNVPVSSDIINKFASELSNS